MTKRPSVTDQPGTAAGNRVRIDQGNAQAIGQLKSTMGQQPIHVRPREPILMLSTSDLTGRPWRGNNRRKGKNGIERLPSVAHTDIGSNEVAEETRGRFRTMLDAHGHECSVVHSNGSSHAPAIAEGKWSDDGYARYVLSKGYALGWVEHPESGGCLKRQVSDKRVNAARLLTREQLSKATVCPAGQKSCKHYDAEREARQVANAKREAANAERFKAGDAKRHDELVHAAGAGAADAIAAALAKALPTIIAAVKESK